MENPIGGVLLMGRKTWQQFSRISPGRTGDFAAAMNCIPKLVVSRSLTDLSAWENSTLLSRDLLEAVAEQKKERDDVVGSASVVHTLAERDLVDEYRILLSPISSTAAPGCSPPRRLPLSHDRSLPSPSVRPFSRAMSAKTFDSGNIPRDLNQPFAPGLAACLTAKF